MEQMPGQDSTTDFAKKRGKQKRLSLDEYAASLLQWLPSGIAASRAFQKTALAAVTSTGAKASPMLTLQSSCSYPSGLEGLPALIKIAAGSGGIRTHASEETGA
ncbi:hypothetical protein Q8A67_020799 [Cirrhinus molitorella]|uniref:Uncharacterized protein n=1 Tax=Cirrhinus molitorella TaxID=172907 RepID=A0AA88PCJ8_9TELE|nr:hypothetical protein Q8A67_020799 [Cirrhinus molitorella]